MSSTNSPIVNEPAKPKVADAYADLGVSPAASKAQIKAAFNRLALLHHPDKKAPGQVDDATKFRRIYEAWDLLRNEEAKAKYDKDYSNVIREWSAYRTELAEFQEDPRDWRRKRKAEIIQQQVESDLKAAAERMATGRRHQPQSQRQYEYYENSDSNLEDFWDYAQFYGHSFGNGNYGRSNYMRSDYGNSAHDCYGQHASAEDLDEWLNGQIRAQHQRDQSERLENLKQKTMRQEVNKRCLEKLKQAAEAQKTKSDSIRVSSVEEKCLMAEDWVKSLQRDYAAELQKEGVKSVENVDIGWEKKKGRQQCTFCSVKLSEFSFRCPSGGAIACRGCKKKIELSSLKKPFAFENAGAGSREEGKKEMAAKKAKKSKPEPESESESEAEEGWNGKDDSASEDEIAKKAAEEAEHKTEAEQQKQQQEAERQAQEKLEREAAEKTAQEKAAREKAEAKEVARKRAAQEQAAREVAEQKKEARDREARKKKTARKKAAKERAALEKAARKGVVQGNGGNQQGIQDREAKEQEAQQAREKNIRETVGLKQRQAQEAVEREARECMAEEAKECLDSGLQEIKTAQEAKEKGKQEAKDGMAREANEKKEIQVNRQEAETMIPSVSSPDQPNFATTTNATKKAKKKGPKCYFCNERGHMARNCFKKQVKLNGVAKVRSCPPAKSAPTIEAMNKRLPPTPTAEKIVAKPPIHSNLKAEHDLSVGPTENTSFSELPTNTTKSRGQPSKLPRTKPMTPI